MKTLIYSRGGLLQKKIKAVFPVQLKPARRPGQVSCLTLKMLQFLRLSELAVCRRCQGAGCRDCCWFGTDEARESFERAKSMVSDLLARQGVEGDG